MTKPANASQSSLQASDDAFDPSCNLILRPAATPGYHTKIAPGTPAHSTRESIHYAQALFGSGESWRHDRARAILAGILGMQERDPTSIWFGLWGWFSEEPPREMAPADWNWADFIGASLAEIIARFPHLLTPDLLQESGAALGRASSSIFRRNVQTDYTNICAMGAAVCLAAGELLDEPLLSAYGLERLRNLRKRLESDGGFCEYNSSTYTLVALIEFERILTGVHFVTGTGDFHPTLDTPADGSFPTGDLRLRVEVEGIGLTREQTGDRIFAFGAGSRRAVVHAGPGWFEGRPIEAWEMGGDGDLKWVDFVFYSGTRRNFHPGIVGETGAALALELLAASEAPSTAAIECSHDASHRIFKWRGERPHEVRVPLRGGRRPWP